MQFFQGYTSLVTIPAWGWADIKVSQVCPCPEGKEKLKSFALSVKVAPASEGSRGVLCDLNEVAKLGPFVGSESGNVYLGRFLATRARGEARLAFLPSSAFLQARMRLVELLPTAQEEQSLLGGEE